MIELAAGDRVLLTRLDYLGDVILSLPLVDAIRKRYPNVEVDYLTRRPAADLLAGDPRFGRVFAMSRKPGAFESLRLVSQLRARRYSSVIDLYSNPRSAWLSWLTGAEVRVGGDRRGRRHLYTHPMNVPRAVRPASQHHMHFGEPIGVTGAAGRPALDVHDSERAAAHEWLRRVPGDGPVLVVHPGGKWPVKRWPTESFAALLESWGASVSQRVVVLTGPGEEVHTHALRERYPAATYAPVLPIREVAALLAAADAVAACDGGIMHLSVAVGTPTVGIFGSAEPDIWFPYEDLGPFRAAWIPVDCRPCHQHVCPLGHTNCLNMLSADHVMELLRDVMRRPAEAGQ